MIRFLLPLFLLLIGNHVMCQIRVGVITDYDQNDQQALIENIINEIDRTTGSGRPISSSSQLQFYGINSFEEAPYQP